MDRKRIKRRPFQIGAVKYPADHPWPVGDVAAARGVKVHTELTPIGEQYVIPGCEKHERPPGSQLKLWEA